MAIRIYEDSLFKRTEQVVSLSDKSLLSDKDQLARPKGGRIRSKVQTKNLMCMEKTTGIRTGRKPQKDPVDKSTVSD